MTQPRTVGRTGTRFHDDDDFRFNEAGATASTRGKWPTVSLGSVLLCALLAVSVALGTGVSSLGSPSNADARALARRVKLVGDSLNAMHKALAVDAKTQKSEQGAAAKATAVALAELKTELATLRKAHKVRTSESKTKTNAADAKELTALRNEITTRAAQDAKTLSQLKLDVASLTETIRAEKKTREADENAQDKAAMQLKADVGELVKKVAASAGSYAKKDAPGSSLTTLSAQELNSLKTQIETLVDTVDGLRNSRSELSLEIAAVAKRVGTHETASTRAMDELTRKAGSFGIGARGTPDKQLTRVDYALFSGGGKVVGHSVLSPLVAKSQGPLTRALTSLRGGVHPKGDEWLLSGSTSAVVPGECLALRGPKGFVDIRVREQIFVTAISIEHVDANAAYDVSSAPKGITVLGWNSTRTPPSGKKTVVLGTVRYELSRELSTDLRGGASVGAAQTFALGSKKLNLGHASPGAVDHVRFEIQSNYGNDEWTCLYRLRVHGVPVAARRTVNYE